MAKRIKSKSAYSFLTLLLSLFVYFYSSEVLLAVSKNLNNDVIRVSTNETSEWELLKRSNKWLNSDLPPCPKSLYANWTDCFGGYEYDDGDKFFGEWVNNEIGDFGFFWTKDNSFYVGEFKNSNFHGDGTYSYPDGITTYEGGFEQGYFQGYGVKKQEGQYEYKGEFKKDLFQGRGKLTLLDGDPYENRHVYSGSFQQGEFHGEGTYTVYLNGVVKSKTTGHWIAGELEQEENPKLEKKPADVSETELVSPASSSLSSDIAFVQALQEFDAKMYGSFLHTERVPHALFFFNEIEQDDFFSFRKALRNNQIDLIVLGSGGGLLFEGLQMASTIFDKKLNTYIPPNVICASACSFMFFAGNEKFVEGKLGVHQFASDAATQRQKQEIGITDNVAQLTVSEIIGYLNEFKTPPFVYERMFEDIEMYYFNKKELEQLDALKPSKSISSRSTAASKFLNDFAEVLSEKMCDNNIEECRDEQLCARATKKNNWLEVANAKKFVDAAKKKELSCGVPTCETDLSLCSTGYICSKATGKTEGRLNWLDNQFKIEAKNRGLSCNIKSFVCENFAAACTTDQLCLKATAIENGNTVWNTSPQLNSYVLLAKKKFLSCNVAICRDVPEICRSYELCSYATIKKNGTLIWQKKLIWLNHVKIAKQRNLTCGVPELTCSSSNTSMCTDSYVCATAVWGNSGNKKWSESSSKKPWVAEAKKRSLSCGVVSTCSDDPEKCPKEKLCDIATEIDLGFIHWKLTNGQKNDHAKSAIKRGVDCNVGQSVDETFTDLKKEIQKQLNRLGCNAGVVDGIFGKRTYAAIKRIEKQRPGYVLNITDPYSLRATSNKLAQLKASEVCKRNQSKASAGNQCKDDPKYCNEAQLCELGTKYSEGKVIWESSESKSSFANEAKRRSFKCGVSTGTQKNSTASNKSNDSNTDDVINDIIDGALCIGGIIINPWNALISC